MKKNDDISSYQIEYLNSITHELQKWEPYELELELSNNDIYHIGESFKNTKVILAEHNIKLLKQLCIFVDEFYPLLLDFDHDAQTWYLY